MRTVFKVAIGAAVSLLLVVLTPPLAFAGVRVLKVDLGSAYRTDEFNWNISGFFDHDRPINVLSELSWEDLDIFQIETGARLVLDSAYFSVPLVLQGRFDYGWILSGKNQDSDFAGPDRTLEFSRSNNGADGGNVLDLSLGTGPQFRGPGNLRFTLLAGYSFHRQTLMVTDGYQTLSKQVDTPSGLVVPPPVGPIPGLNSRYRANWRGPWLGVNLDAVFATGFSLATAFQYHFVDYYAEATWNLRTQGAYALAQPKSFEHEGSGRGLVFSVRGNYQWSAAWGLFLQGVYEDWQVEKGTDRIFLASGNVGVSRLNQVNWRSRSILLGATFRFF